jgi:Trypsin-like peptidase domain
MRRRHAAPTAVALLAGLLLAALGASPAAAHDHPTKAELAAPGVVFVKTFARVEISLIEHNRLGRHIGLVQRRYEPELASGSGFAVDPNGTIVTAGGVITPDMERARIYAVNKVFNERYGRNAPMPRDPFARQTIRDLAADPINTRLQRCYQPNTTDDTGGCLLTVNRVVKVFPWVSDQGKYGNLVAEVLSPAESKAQDVAVLRIGASSMPTVGLGQSPSASKAFTALGFSGIPTAKSSSELQLVGHFKNPGSLPLDPDKYLAKLLAGLRAGVRGGPVVAADTGQVMGLLSLPADSTRTVPASVQPAFVDAKRIREVLASVDVQPLKGPTDAVFEDAMHSYKNKLYTAPIPSFQRALELYPGHALATEYLAVSKAKAGTAEDLTGKEGGGLAEEATGPGGLPGWLPIAVGAVVLLAVLAAVALALRRRRAAAGEDGGDAGAAAPPSSPPPPGLAHQAVGRAPAPGQHPGLGATGPVAVGAALPKAPPDASKAPTDGPPKATASPAPSAEHKPPVKRFVTPDNRRASQVGAVVGRPREAAAPAPGAAKITGSSATPASYCTQCGQRLSAQHRFCGYCGTPVG